MEKSRQPAYEGSVLSTNASLHLVHKLLGRLQKLGCARLYVVDR